MPKTPDSSLPPADIYGTVAQGHLPWKQRQIHQLAQRAQLAGARDYHKLPSVIVQPNRLQNLVSSQVEQLFKKRDLNKLQEYEFANKPKISLLKPLDISPEALAGHIINIFGDISPDRIDNEILAQSGLNPVIGHFQLDKVRKAYAQGIGNPIEPIDAEQRRKRREEIASQYRHVPNTSSAAASSAGGSRNLEELDWSEPMQEIDWQDTPSSSSGLASRAAAQSPSLKSNVAPASSAATFSTASKPYDAEQRRKRREEIASQYQSERAAFAAAKAKPKSTSLTSRALSALNEPSVSHLERKDQDISRRPSFAEVLPGRGRRHSMPELVDLQTANQSRAVENADEDTFDIAKKEIKKSFSKRHVEEALPKIDRVNVPALHGENSDIINEFMHQYDKMGNAIRDENAEHYLRNVAPKLNYQYMQGGRWNSPSRSTHQNLVLSELHKNMDRDLTKLRTQGFEKALHEIGQHKDRRLASEHLSANLVHREKEQANVGARNLADIEKSELLDKMARIGVAKEQGAEQHLRDKERLLAQRMEAEEMHEHPWKMIEREAAIAQGLPAPAHLNTQRLMENMRPNIADTVGTGIGNLAMMGLLQRRKAGGMVGKYAPGGFVMPKVQISPEEMQMQQQAQEMQNHNIHGDPRLHAIARMGFGMAARPRGQSPGEAHAHASLAAMDTLNNHHSSHQNQKERGIALMQQIQQSRLKQQQVIAEFEHRNKQFEASQANHNAAFAEQKRHHMAVEGNAHSKDNLHREVTIGGKTFRSQQKLGLSPQDQAQARKNEEALAKLESREAPYDETLEFLSTNTPSTGWIAEHTPDFSDKSREYQRKLSSMISSVVAPGVMTKAKLDFAKQQKPSQMDSPEAVKEFASKGKKVIEEDKEPLMLAQQYRTYGIPDRITLGAYNAWVKNDKQGEFDDYLSAVLEGAAIPTTSQQPTKQQVQAELKKRGLI